MVRFRPIVKMTMAAVMGPLPLVFATGIGADSRRPLSLSWPAARYFPRLRLSSPVLYTYLERFAERWSSASSGVPRDFPWATVLMRGDQ